MRRGVAVLFSALLASGVAGALLVAFVVQANPAEAAFPGKNGKIVYVRNYSIYSMSSQGTDLKRLTTDPGEKGSPDYSPDGRQITFEGPGTGDNASNIWLMRADGSNRRKVTVEKKLPGGFRLNYDPAFSPGGHRIVFVRGASQSDSAYDLYVIKRDGTGLRRVFDSPAAHPRDPVFSPNGRKIAFEYDGQIATVRPDGTHFSILRDGYSPDWSPGGKRIAFSHKGPPSEGRTTSEIYTMRADGGGVRRVTDSPPRHIAAYPAYSPGGGKIAFADHRGGDWEIYTIGIDGSDEKRLTRNEAEDYQPSWQPVP